MSLIWIAILASLKRESSQKNQYKKSLLNNKFLKEDIMTTISTLYNEGHIDGFNNLMKAESANKHSVYKARFTCFAQLIHTLNYTFKAEYKKAYDKTIVIYSDKVINSAENTKELISAMKEYKEVALYHSRLTSIRDESQKKIDEKVASYKITLTQKIEVRYAQLIKKRAVSREDQITGEYFQKIKNLLEQPAITKDALETLVVLKVHGASDLLQIFNTLIGSQGSIVDSKKIIYKLESRMSTLLEKNIEIEAILKPQVALPVSPTAVIDKGDDDKKAQMSVDAILPAPVAVANSAEGAAVGAVADAVKQPTLTAADSAKK
jgi:hypothetical protein